ncbi:hypothetical protein ACV33R_31775, partial [Pseudomonas aeruginosa]
IGLPGATGVMNFVVLVAALSAMNSQLYITTRMMFSLSRAGHPPKGLGELSRQGDTDARQQQRVQRHALATLL